MGTLSDARGQAAQAASRSEHSTALDRGIRVGLVAYGVTHLLIAATALPLVWGEDTEGPASQQGAFAQLAETGLGKAALLVIALGFAAMLIWQSAEAFVGHRDSDGAGRVFKRVASGAKAVLYGVLGYTAVSVALGGGGGGGGSKDSLTAQLLRAPLGQLLVGAVGVGIIAVGGYLAYKGLAEKFTKRLDARATSGDRGKAVRWLGKVGYVTKGIALGAIGALFVTAAVQHDPQESGGLDVALHELLRQPFGVVLVAAVALGLGCFGLYCFAWARHLRR